MKQKLKSGTELLPHELLEVLLGYAIPRKDTNDLAHRLIHRFGSLHGVFSATYEELLSVHGVGEHCASLLKLMPPTLVAVCDEFDALYATDEPLDSMDAIAAYGARLFRQSDAEVVYVLLLDAQDGFVDCVRLAGGSTAGAEVNFRSLIKDSSLRKCATAVLLHNHPGGALKPSESDKEFTTRIAELFSLMGVEVVEHVIISDGRYVTVMAPCGPNRIRSGFYNGMTTPK